MLSEDLRALAQVVEVLEEQGVEVASADPTVLDGDVRASLVVKIPDDVEIATGDSGRAQAPDSTSTSTGTGTDTSASTNPLAVQEVTRDDGRNRLLLPAAVLHHLGRPEYVELTVDNGEWVLAPAETEGQRGDLVYRGSTPCRIGDAAIGTLGLRSGEEVSYHRYGEAQVRLEAVDGIMADTGAVHRDDRRGVQDGDEEENEADQAAVDEDDEGEDEADGVELTADMPIDVVVQARDGMGHTTASQLIDAGFETLGELVAGDPAAESLTEIRKIGPATAESVCELIDDVRDEIDAGDVTVDADVLEDEGDDEQEYLDHTSTEDLRRAYDEADGVISKAAERFDITKSGVYRAMKRHGIHEPDSDDGDDSEADQSEDESDDEDAADEPADPVDGPERDEAEDSEDAGEEPDEDGGDDFDDQESADDDECQDEQADRKDPYDRRCASCSISFHTSPEYYVHRTEVHDAPQAQLDYLEPGEFESLVEDAEDITDLKDELGWGSERLLRLLGIYGLEGALTGDVELSELTDVDLDVPGEGGEPGGCGRSEGEDEAQDQDTTSTDDETAQADDGAAVSDGGIATPSQTGGVEPDGAWREYIADPAPKNVCANCGSHVPKKYHKVFTPEDEEQPQACPNCEDVVRDSVTGEIREKRHSGVDNS